MALDDKKPEDGGVWKSGRGRGRAVPKGRQLDDVAHGKSLNCWGRVPGAGIC